MVENGRTYCAMSVSTKGPPRQLNKGPSLGRDIQKEAAGRGRDRSSFKMPAKFKSDQTCLLREGRSHDPDVPRENSDFGGELVVFAVVAARTRCDR